MTIIITAIATFICFFLLSVCLGIVSVVVALVVGMAAPSAREACAKCIAGWRSRRGLRKRLLVVPFSMTLLIFVVSAVIGLTDTMRIRSEITGSSHVVVRSGGNCHRRLEQEPVLLHMEDVAEIRALAQHVAVGLSMPGMQCKCCGDMTFDFYRGDEIRYSFSFHHGKSIRIKGNFLGDKKLTAASRRKLNIWLDQTGVTKALEEAREQKRLRQEADLKTMKEAAHSSVDDVLKAAPAEYR